MKAPKLRKYRKKKTYEEKATCPHQQDSEESRMASKHSLELGSTR